MPKVWNGTIEAHRRSVRDAILEATAALVAENGLAAVTMSQIAEAAGIGRATLYKYFPDLEAILSAWHQQHVTTHLDHLAKLAKQPGDAGARLAAVLHHYALIAHQRGRHAGDLAALLHGSEYVARAQQQLLRLMSGLVAAAVKAGDVRDDVPGEELARYCIHALNAAGTVPSKVAVERLVALTLAGLRPPR
jgi:AcrR family transcriptional regulator